MRIRIAQVYRVEMWITLDVEGDTLDEAIETYQSGETPPSSDPRWEDYWNMENEEITEVIDAY